MKAEESQLTAVFADSKTYEIPRYQRPYSWSETNAYDLVNDTYDAFETKDKEYFIGSVIYIEKEKDKLFDVVDGQQRLTTLTILFSKLRDLIKDEAAKSEIQKRILPINALTKKPQTPRLTVRQQDQSFFEKYILLGEVCTDKTDLSETQIKFLVNSNVFHVYLADKTENELCLFANFLLENVYIVSVKTENLQSAYRLFNVLNARGLPLSNADLIKNKLFDIAKDDDEQDTIEEKWTELEDIIGISNLDVFLGHHRTSLKGDKQGQTLIKEYENYIETSGTTATAFLESLVKSAKNYRKLNKNDFDSLVTKRLMTSLKLVSHDEWIPPILAYINIKGIDDKFEDFVKNIDRITYQNWIRKLGKTQRNTVYYNVVSLLLKGGSSIDVINKIKEYKNNAEFMQNLHKDFYGNSYDTAVLLRLEQEMQDLSVTKIYEETISIEHILPQRLTNEYWIQRFTHEDHNYWLHKIGNLTLLSGRKNILASNNDFPKKKDHYDKKNKKVSFDLTKDICLLSDWDLDAIKSRHQALVDKAGEIWGIE